MDPPVAEGGRLRPLGTGKTFFLEALGLRVVKAGMRVACFLLEDLGALMRGHRSDNSVTRVVIRILHAIAIDGMWLLLLGTNAAEGLHRLVDVAFKKQSIASSLILHPGGFGELMPETLATATVDRLLYPAHVGRNPGELICLKKALAGESVIPMN